MVVPKRDTLGFIAFSVVAMSASLHVDGFVSPQGASVSPSSHSSSATPRQPSQTEPFLCSSWHARPHGTPGLSQMNMATGSFSDDGSKSSNSWDNSQFPPSGNPSDRMESSDPIGQSGKFRTDHYEGYDGAFPLPDNVDIPQSRQLRWEREALLQSKFAAGDEVFELREKVAMRRHELVQARRVLEESFPDVDDDDNAERMVARSRVRELERKILSLNSRDAEFVYSVALERMAKARAAGDAEALESSKREAEEARLCIPQLNMHGLWIGKYGEHGYEMINVTYSGDTMIATKVTGDKNVPRGEVSFTVDLSPQSPANSRSKSLSALEPIELNARAARQWGKRFLPRHPGRGQVASEGYQNAQWMEGQLILVGRFFSFAWVPIGHQVFFGRPSPELTLKMLKEQRSEELKKDHVAVMKDAAEKCWDETYWSDKESEGYFTQEGCFE